MRNIIIEAIFIAVIFLAMITLGNAHGAELPTEPEFDNQLIGCFIDPEGSLLVFEYDLNHDNVVDYITGRTFGPFQAGGKTYFRVMRWPIYYGLDLDGNGRFSSDELFIDDAQDGVNGNEIPLIIWEEENRPSLSDEIEDAAQELYEKYKKIVDTL